MPLAVGLSGQSLGLFGTVFPFWIFPSVSSSVYLPFVLVVAVAVGCPLRCMACNVTCNVLLLPSVLSLTLFLLCAVYPLYIPALRNLDRFE